MQQKFLLQILLLSEHIRAPLCPSSGAQEYYTMVSVCGIWCCGFQVAGLVWSYGLCVWFAGCCSFLSPSVTIKLLSKVTKSARLHYTQTSFNQ